jgi:hypothetical protein
MPQPLLRYEATVLKKSTTAAGCGGDEATVEHLFV